MKKRKRSKLSLFILLGVIAYFAYLLLKQQFLLDAKAAEMKEVQDKIAIETEQKLELEKQKERISSAEYFEKVAREQLGMIKHNEKVFIDIDK